MDVMRRIRGSAAGRLAVAVLGAGYILLVHFTTRWTIIGAEQKARLVGGEGRVIAGLWHGRILGLPGEKTRDFDCAAIVSSNRDGEIIATTLKLFGIGALRGSSWDRVKKKDKGGREAYEAALALIRANDRQVIAFTPDGPRGPRMRCHQGIAALSVETGIPVVPVTFSTRRGKVLRSWDRMLVPWPFNRGVKIFGDLIHPPEGDDPDVVERHRLAIEEALNRLTREADEMCGRTPVEPAEPEM